MISTSRPPVSNIATEEYEPYFAEGKRFGDVHWLRTESGGEGMLLSGFWRHEPAELPYEFAGDETVLVLDGEVVIEIAGEASVTLRRGDVASFTKGTTSTWRITQPFKKFFVVSG